MASIILSDNASAFTRTALNGLGVNKIPFFGSRISNAATSFTSGIFGNIGKQIDASIFGTKTVNRTRGGRLNDLQVQSSAYGEFINQIYGQVRIAGNVIWSQPIRESVNVTAVNSGGGKGASPKPTKYTETRYSYSVSIAIALCEGEIDNVIRVWADAKLINPADYCISYRLYKGSEEQLPDTLIEALEGPGKAPAYRGLAYIVFEDFQLAAFGNRIPNFTFEVRKNYKNSFSGTSAEELVKCVTLIPGSGEFVYDTTIQKKLTGNLYEGESGPDTFIQSGKYKRINNNSYQSRADVMLTLDDLQETFPNLEYVSIVCCWFGDSLDAATCLVEPCVEANDNISTKPGTWSVGAYNRENARMISLDAEGRPNYGGTPSDSSILNLVAELKERGLKVMFYPMLFMDVENKPWRGHMTAAAGEISNFFTKVKGYNQFIMHYANLLQAEVDAFIIGSEFKGLTSVQAGDDSFPAVDSFIELAQNVKAVMSSATKISYAADWSEYHSVNGWYNLDPLWTCDAIDFIGIDAYFPLTDRPQNNQYNLTEVIEGWQNGEGYDWYYTDEARTVKASLAPAYAWKNIEYWWRNNHVNPDSTVSPWLPESKKIWFTEYGFPSVDGATNQPNVFFSPDSSDSALPYFSKGNVDYQAQRLGIEATEVKWLGSEFVENKFLWCFDARPYPYWPDLNEVWSDGAAYRTGHWVNGKFGTSGLAEVLLYLAQKAGIDNGAINAEDINANLDGFVVNGSESIADIIKTLQEVYFFNVIEKEGIITFAPQPKGVMREIDHEELIAVNKGTDLIENIMPQNILPAKFDFSFINKNNNYLTANEHAEYPAAGNDTRGSNKIPVVLETSYARNVAELTLLRYWAENKSFSFALNTKYADLNLGDVIKLNGNKLLIENIEYETGRLLISARIHDEAIYENRLSGAEANRQYNIEPNADELITHILDLPCLPQNDANSCKLHFAITSEGLFRGAEIFASDDEGENYSRIAFTASEAVTGKCVNILPEANPFIFDDNFELEVILLNGELQSRNELSILNGAGAAIIGDEVVQFKNAVLTGDNKYKLSGFLRGRLGTENRIEGHTEFERFILLDNMLVEIDVTEQLIGQSRKYKIVPSGKTLLDVASMDFTYEANCMKPYPVVDISQYKNGDDIIMSWNRRTRNNGNLKNLVEVPLLEATEKYEADILSGSNIVRTIYTASANLNYNLAYQIEDFGNEQSLISVNIYQISEKTGRGFKAEN